MAYSRQHPHPLPVELNAYLTASIAFFAIISVLVAWPDIKAWAFNRKAAA